jgi:hypothetical protein
MQEAARESAEILRTETGAAFAVVLLADGIEEGHHVIVGAQVPDVRILRKMLQTVLLKLGDGTATIIRGGR